MNLHEYQAKELMRRHGVPVPPGEPATSLVEANDAIDKLFAEGHARVVVKSQIHAGGRGKGTFKDGFQGGVHLADSAEDAKAKAGAMFGNVLITKQTGEEGKQVNRLLITSAQEIKSEYYVAVLLDRAQGRPILMASAEGGVNIEEVAEESPEKIFKETIDPDLGMQPYQGRKIAIALGLRGKLIGQCARLLQNLYETWSECDASMVEVNPMALIENENGTEAVVALDAKMSIDGNAMFRHPDIAEMRDLSEEDPLEVEAGKFDLNYIKLDGNIACLVNGAGLAMSTMDAIKHYGGEPANFLDVGGGATQEQVKAAFEIILSDPSVEAILINIFGGIMNCNTIAEGVVAAAKETDLKLPLVVRLEGNNVDAGRQTLAESGLPLITAESMAEAAQKSVEAAK
ncbi:MAG TPA: ADP-forming succinate--CoA ligase subunit beta [Verrucomicrobiales bacterium]|nr:ADP-forming succinate--CoA ligase subunit beta [Verrucomicrobiales bacterium]|tara:strand:+ start:196 stop:1398 length:1203 start_codon:yes stop_codon:yes gene_type:complete